MRFKLACIKLTCFYVLIAMSISVAFSIALFRISSEELGRGLVRQTRVLRNLPMRDVETNQLPDLESLRVNQLEESMRRLKLNLICFNLLILLLSSGSSYFLAKKTLQPIEEAIDTQNRFTADASHELRTPLTAMKTEIEVNLRDKKFDLSNAKKLLESNLEEIEKLESLSNALLKLAHAENVQHKFEEISIPEIVVDAYEKVENLAKKKEIEFETDYFSSTERSLEASNSSRQTSNNIYVMGNKQSLIELLVILLDNAIKYSPKKSKIFITAKQLEKHVLLSIEDEGVGIKACDLPFIFNRFYRSDTSRSKEKTSGYGLGLSIAKQIVDLHHGSISVKSKPGEGSEFTVKLLRKCL